MTVSQGEDELFPNCEMVQQVQLNLSILWRISSDSQGWGHVCEGIRQPYL